MLNPILTTKHVTCCGFLSLTTLACLWENNKQIDRQIDRLTDGRTHIRRVRKLESTSTHPVKSIPAIVDGCSVALAFAIRYTPFIIHLFDSYVTLAIKHRNKPNDS